MFNLCRKRLSNETYKQIEKYCNDTGAYAYHVEDGKCTEFSNPVIEARPATNKTSSTKGVSIPTEGGLSLTYSIKDSVCKGTGDEKKMTVSLMCDPKEDNMHFMEQKFFK